MSPARLLSAALGFNEGRKQYTNPSRASSVQYSDIVAELVIQVRLTVSENVQQNFDPETVPYWMYDQIPRESVCALPKLKSSYECHGLDVCSCCDARE